MAGNSILDKLDNLIECSPENFFSVRGARYRPLFPATWPRFMRLPLRRWCRGLSTCRGASPERACPSTAPRGGTFGGRVIAQEWAGCSTNRRIRRPFGEFNLYRTTTPVPQGRNNQEPGTEVPGIRYKTDESRQGRHRYPKCHSVPSLSGLDHFVRPTRHFRAGLLIVPSLRDLVQWCNTA
jgi:hypothetical protein